MQLVVVMAVRNAVSAATTTFTAISITFFLIAFLISQSLRSALPLLQRLQPTKRISQFASGPPAAHFLCSFHTAKIQHFQ
jgi:hypothetical protein